MRGKVARDLLIPLENYPHATESTTLGEAIDILETAQIDFRQRKSVPRVLLVFDSDNQLMGMVRRRDLLRGIEPQFGEQLDVAHPEAHVKLEVDPELTALLSEIDPEQLREKLACPLESIVRPLEASVDIDDPFLKIVRELVSKDTHIAIVLDAGRLARLVRTQDPLDLVPNAEGRTAASAQRQLFGSRLLRRDRRCAASARWRPPGAPRSALQPRKVCGTADGRGWLRAVRVVARVARRR